MSHTSEISTKRNISPRLVGLHHLAIPVSSSLWIQCSSDDSTRHQDIAEGYFQAFSIGHVLLSLTTFRTALFRNYFFFFFFFFFFFAAIRAHVGQVPESAILLSLAALAGKFYWCECVGNIALNSNIQSMPAYAPVPYCQICFHKPFLY